MNNEVGMQQIEIYQNEEGKSQLALKIMGDSRFSPGAVSDRLKKGRKAFFCSQTNCTFR